MAIFDVTQIHPGLAAIAPLYQKIIDCQSASAIKAKTTLYLPMPNVSDQTDENIQRYSDYLHKAIFTGTLIKTINSLTGLQSSKDNTIVIDPILFDDIDGTGLGIEQQIKKIIGDVSAIGRSGVLVDYDNNRGEVSQDDLNTGRVRAYITRYDALDIIWPTDNLVVLKESYFKDSDDGYTKISTTQFKVLVMRDGVYVQEIWRANANGKYQIFEELTKAPTDSKGNYFDHIPFHYVGSENNEATYDAPPMETLADLSIGRYINSADYEENVYECGQTTVVVVGLTRTWLKEVLGGVLSMGPRGGIPLESGADAKLLQASPNTLAFEAMNHKEEQMIAFGAQLVTQATGKKTATQTNRESSTEDSTLMTVVRNTERAYRSASKDIELFTGTGFEEFELNKDFTTAIYDSLVATSLLNDYLQGAGKLEDVYNYKVETGMIAKDITFDKWKNDIENTVPVSDAEVDD